MVSRFFVPALSLGLALSLATPGLARDCQINGLLRLQGKTLPSAIYVGPDEKAYFDGLGMPMSPGLFQGYGVTLRDIYLWFDENGCNQDLVDRVLSKARVVRDHKAAPPPKKKPAKKYPPEDDTPGSDDAY